MSAPKPFRFKEGRYPQNGATQNQRPNCVKFGTDFRSFQDGTGTDPDFEDSGITMIAWGHSDACRCEVCRAVEEGLVEGPAASAIFLDPQRVKGD